MPERLKSAAEMYPASVSRAIQKQEYLDLISQSGSENITLRKENLISLPDDILLNYLSAKEIEACSRRDAGIYSVTVFAQKGEAKNCCAPTCCN
jgi:hypothetical protein